MTDAQKRIEPTRDQHIREIRLSVLSEAARALKSCAKVLERAAEALAEEDA